MGNKISQSLGLLWKEKRTWARLKKLTSKQKQAMTIINNEYFDKRWKKSGMKILNIRKINIYQVLNFMFKIKSKTARSVFQTNFTEIYHSYPIWFSKDSFVENQIVLVQKINLLFCLEVHFCKTNYYIGTKKL